MFLQNILIEEKDDDTWTEVTIPAPPDLDGTVETSSSETSVMVEEKETPTETDQEAEEPELEGIETKGAEKRIRQLIKQRKERDEALVKTRNELDQLRHQMAEVGKVKFDYDDALATAKEGEITSKLESARNKFKDAYDAGNKDNVLEAQEQLSEAQTNLNIWRNQQNLPTWTSSSTDERIDELVNKTLEYHYTISALQEGGEEIN